MARANGTRSALRGITLIEVLVSVVVLAVGATAVAEALARASYAMTVADQYTVSHTFAMSKISDIERAARAGELADEAARGTFQIGPDRYSWEVSTTPVPEQPLLQTVELAVRWNRGLRAYERTLTTLVSLPEPEASPDAP
jgi:prepilin-type N-terminal cleavage/methylation domain-containing protein